VCLLLCWGAEGLDTMFHSLTNWIGAQRVYMQSLRLYRCWRLPAAVFGDASFKRSLCFLKLDNLWFQIW
jgi:hypothetical protein